MPLKQRLENDLHVAMKSGDNNAKQTIRLALSNMKLAEVQKGSPLEDTEIVSLLQKEIKSRSETILDAVKINRQDIIDEAKAEIKIIETYLPQQLTQDELTEIIKSAISETNALGMSDMGKVMKVALAKVLGRSSNDNVSKTVREMLSSIK
jgi:uncharacterized protein YqeY